MCMVILELDRDQSFVLSEDFTFSRYMKVFAYVFDNDPVTDSRLAIDTLSTAQRLHSTPETEMYRDSPVGIYPENLLRDSRYNRNRINMNMLSLSPTCINYGTRQQHYHTHVIPKGQSIRMKIEDFIFAHTKMTIHDICKA